MAISCPARILLVDDHASVRRSLRELVEDEGCVVCGEGEDGEQAVRLAGELSPDVIVLDISMPRMNGLEAARRIRIRWPEMKVLIVTHHDSEHLRRLAIEAGARGFLHKDQATDLLGPTLRELIPKNGVVRPVER